MIDYAGLFPPAALAMAPAAEEYARRRHGPRAWALSRFIVPVTRLDELEIAAAGLVAAEDPWPLSVLAGADFETDRRRIEDFDRRGPGAKVRSIELKASTPEQVEHALAVFAGLGVELYVEIPPPGSDLLATLAGRAAAKIRTGGVTADAFPAASEIARFLAAANAAGVAFKATAGLHHPLRGEHPLTYEPASPCGTMHGFFNLFLAAGFIHHGKLGEPEVVELLEERSPVVFGWEEETVRWRGVELTSEEIAHTRLEFARSYGSCSFAEPIADLEKLGWLEPTADDQETSR